jgi:hypothetical protein
MTTAIADSLTELRAELVRRGYMETLPPEASLRAVAEVDAALCRDEMCEQCGQVGLAYTCFYRATPRAFRAFAHCSACGQAMAF